jgi:predicted nucleic-acid-binding Zn-ribbon protein
VIKIKSRVTCPQCGDLIGYLNREVEHGTGIMLHDIREVQPLSRYMSPVCYRCDAAFILHDCDSLGNVTESRIHIGKNWVTV